tara:strand:+ start:3002 stop:6949 length:3948 start_codon:yes stop_codon:yes gene_type:complete
MAGGGGDYEAHGFKVPKDMQLAMWKKDNPNATAIEAKRAEMRILGNLSDDEINEALAAKQAHIKAATIYYDKVEGCLQQIKSAEEAACRSYQELKVIWEKNFTDTDNPRGNNEDWTPEAGDGEYGHTWSEAKEVRFRRGGEEGIKGEGLALSIAGSSADSRIAAQFFGAAYFHARAMAENSAFCADSHRSGTPGINARATRLVWHHQVISTSDNFGQFKYDAGVLGPKHGQVLPSSLKEGYQNTNVTKADREKIKLVIQYAGTAHAHAHQAYWTQLGAKSSDPNDTAWQEAIKLSYHWSSGAGARDQVAVFGGSSFKKGLAEAKEVDPSAILPMGARRWSNGTLLEMQRELKDALKRLIAADINTAANQKLHDDLGNRIGGLSRQAKNIANGYSCWSEASNIFANAQQDYNKVIADLAGSGSRWEGVKNILGGEGWDGLNDYLIDMLDDSHSAAAYAAQDRQRTIFNEQCFLLSYISDIAAHKKRRDSIAPRSGSIAASCATGETPGKGVPYLGEAGNSSLLVDGDPYGFLNKLTQTGDQKVFFNMKSDVLNHLQPMIRLFKVAYDSDNETTEQEFVFQSWGAHNLQAVLKRKEQRGFGVGVKSFDFSYEGNNPFAVKKSIKATLKIFANSMSELFDERGGISYSDLALKTKQPTQSTKDCASTAAGGSQSAIGQHSALEEANLDKLNFRLKAVVGWARPSGHGPWSTMSSLTSDPDRNSNNLRDAIYQSYTTLNLTPTVHNFEFDDMGRVIFTIEYLAFVDDYYDSPAFNIFAGTDTTIEQIIRNLQIEYYNRNCKSEEASNVKKTLADKAAAEKSQALTSLIENLKGKKRIYYIKLPWSEVAEFNSAGPFYNWNAGEGAGESFQIESDSENDASMASEMQAAFDSYDFQGAQASKEEQNVFKASLLVENPETINLSFFYISDLIDTILESLEKELSTLGERLSTRLPAEGSDITRCQVIMAVDKYTRAYKNFKKLRILLGPVEFVNQGDKGTKVLGGASAMVNFGDIPISVRYFLEYLADQMLKKERSTYTLTTFLNDLFNKLIRDFLNDETCFDWSIKQRVRVNQAVITSYPQQADGLDEIAASMKASGKARISLSTLSMPILNISGRGPISSPDVAEEVNYFVYFAGRTAPAERMQGNKRDDENAGIFHYQLGRGEGLIKNIKLSKTDSRGLAEVRFEQDGYDGLKQLRVVYDTEIDSYSNVKTYPGTYIYVDPRGFAPDMRAGGTATEFGLTDLGIGGYYMIVKSSHTFAAGQAESKIYAKWVNAIENAAVQAERAADIGDPDASTTGPAQCQSALATRKDDAEEEVVNP